VPFLSKSKSKDEKYHVVFQFTDTFSGRPSSWSLTHHRLHIINEWFNKNKINCDIHLYEIYAPTSHYDNNLLFCELISTQCFFLSVHFQAVLFCADFSTLGPASSMDVIVQFAH
jgi:hypothetical protein